MDKGYLEVSCIILDILKWFATWELSWTKKLKKQVNKGDLIYLSPPLTQQALDLLGKRGVQDQSTCISHLLPAHWGSAPAAAHFWVARGAGVQLSAPGLLLLLCTPHKDASPAAEPVTCGSRPDTGRDWQGGRALGARDITEGTAGGDTHPCFLSLCWLQRRRLSTASSSLTIQFWDTTSE